MGKGSARATLLAAWGSMILASSLTLVAWRQLGSAEPSWWPWVTGAALLAITAIGFIIKALKPVKATSSSSTSSSSSASVGDGSLVSSPS